MNFKKLKISLFSLLALGLLLFIPSVGLAQSDSDNELVKQKIMEYDFAGNSLSDNELNIITNDIDLATKRAEKDAMYLLNKAEEEMNANMKESETKSTQTVYLGTDITLYSCDEGNSGGSDSGLSDYAANYSADDEWADTSISIYGAGSADAWAWVGPKVYISGDEGTGQYAWIKFYGDAYGSLVSGYGGSSTGRIRVSVWDYTRGTEVGGYTVWEDTSSNNGAKVCDVSFSPSFRCYLEAGHTYALRFGNAVSGSLYGVVFTGADFWNNGSNGDGLDADKVEIDF